jgi:ketosteroid isomerase-like protein
MSTTFANDQIEIAAVLYRYAQAIDSKDMASLREVFTPDAVIDYAVPGGTKRPYAEIGAWLAGALSMFRRTHHVVSNPMVEVEGDVARSTAYLTATHEQVGKNGRRTTFIDHGVYVDRWTRTPTGWRISERRLERRFLQGEVQPPESCKTYPGPASNR